VHTLLSGLLFLPGISWLLLLISISMYFKVNLFTSRKTNKANKEKDLLAFA
jgi:hypothetical protein